MSKGLSLGESIALNALLIEMAGENFPLGCLAIDLSPRTMHFPIAPPPPDMIGDDM